MIIDARYHSNDIARNTKLFRPGGVQEKNAFWLDTEAGIARIYRTDANGKIVVDYDAETIVWDEVNVSGWAYSIAGGPLLPL